MKPSYSMAIKKVFRTMELLLALAFITWAIPRIPSAVKSTTECFRRFISVVFSHLFIFLLSNLIVLTLYLNSRSLFTKQSLGTISQTCLEFCNMDPVGSTGEDREFSRDQTEEIVYQDKQTIMEVTRVAQVPVTPSENLEIESIFEKHREEDEMVSNPSSEEFQRSIEAFIAKQIKFHRQEKLAIVLSPPEPEA